MDKNGTSETERPNLSTEHQKKGDAMRPADTLDKGQENKQAIPRKTSLIDNDYSPAMGGGGSSQRHRRTVK